VVFQELPAQLVDLMSRLDQVLNVDLKKLNLEAGK